MSKPLVAAATGTIGLMAAGLTVSLLAFPAGAGHQDPAAKREQDTPDVVLVVDDDDGEDDLTDDTRARAGADTNSRSRASNSGNTGGDQSRSRASNSGNTGGDQSRSRASNSGNTRGDQSRSWASNSGNTGR